MFESPATGSVSGATVDDVSASPRCRVRYEVAQRQEIPRTIWILQLYSVCIECVHMVLAYPVVFAGTAYIYICLYRVHIHIH